jgi:hypothetical protein
LDLRAGEGRQPLPSGLLGEFLKEDAVRSAFGFVLFPWLFSIYFN